MLKKKKRTGGCGAPQVEQGLGHGKLLVVVVVAFIYFWQFQEHKKVTVSSNNLPEKGYSNETMYVIHARKLNHAYAIIIRKRHSSCTFNNQNLGSLLL